jgi:hypothetical protein
MFVQSMEFRADISIYGQESNYTNWRLAKMNLAIRGIDGQIAHGDTFHNDRHPDLKADFILANPPFNISDWGGERLRGDKRWRYGDPPAGNANFAWVQHIVHHLAPAGVAGFVLLNGSMSSNQSGEGEIRSGGEAAGGLPAARMAGAPQAAAGHRDGVALPLPDRLAEIDLVLVGERPRSGTGGATEQRAGKRLIEQQAGGTARRRAHGATGDGAILGAGAAGAQEQERHRRRQSHPSHRSSPLRSGACPGEGGPVARQYIYGA